MQLNNAVALVSGAGGGIASATVEALARAGADVACIDVDPAAAERSAERARSHGRRGLAVSADLSEGTDVERAVESTLEEFARIDVLVNAVGIGGVSEIAGHDEALWDRIIGINLKSIFLMCRSVLPHMIERRTGRIVTITSRAAYRSGAGTAAYSASKGGLLAFSRVLATEAGPHGITVNNIAPGTTLTPMTADFYGGPEGQQREATKSGVVIDPPRLTRPEEIAQAVLYLCGPQSEHVTGSTLHVNGGSYMP